VAASCWPSSLSSPPDRSSGDSLQATDALRDPRNGVLDRRWSAWFDGLEVSSDDRG
jgi:hypothetical protein